jgi:hypothetical protein
MVGLGRLELPTSRLSGVRSNRAELQAQGLVSGDRFQMTDDRDQETDRGA